MSSEDSEPTRERVTAGLWGLTTLKERVEKRIGKLSSLLNGMDSRPLTRIRPEDLWGYLQGFPWKRPRHSERQEYILAADVAEKLRDLFKNSNGKLETSLYSYYMPDSGTLTRYEKK